MTNRTLHWRAIIAARDTVGQLIASSIKTSDREVVGQPTASHPILPMVGWGQKLDGKTGSGSVGQFGTSYCLTALRNIAGLDLLVSSGIANSLASIRTTLETELQAPKEQPSKPPSKASVERHYLDIPRTAESLEAAATAFIVGGGISEARGRLDSWAIRESGSLMGWPSWSATGAATPEPHLLATVLTLIALRREATGPIKDLDEPGLDWITQATISAVDSGQLGLAAISVTALSLMRRPTSRFVARIADPWLDSLVDPDVWHRQEKLDYERAAPLRVWKPGEAKSVPIGNPAHDSEFGPFEIDRSCAILVALPLVDAAKRSRTRLPGSRSVPKQVATTAAETAAGILADPVAWIRRFDHEPQSAARLSFLVKQLDRAYSYPTFWSRFIN